MSDSRSRRWASVDTRSLRRHALVWVARHQHAALVDVVGDPALRDVVASFLADGAPLVVRRQPMSERDGLDDLATLAVGMPLPPAHGKQRLAFTVPTPAIVHSAMPLRLAEVIPHVREPWRTPLTTLLRAACATGIEFRVFGSAAWEALTGHEYLTPSSDIDFIWRPADATQIVEGIALLRTWEKSPDCKADGEILFGDDSAVAWREWQRVVDQRAGERVLVKTLYGPHFVSASELTAGLPRHGAVRRAAAVWA